MITEFLCAQPVSYLHKEKTKKMHRIFFYFLLYSNKVLSKFGKKYGLHTHTHINFMEIIHYNRHTLCVWVVLVLCVFLHIEFVYLFIACAGSAINLIKFYTLLQSNITAFPKTYIVQCFFCFSLH